MPPDPRQFEALLFRAQQGCPEAAGALLDAFRPYLLSLANEEMDLDLQSKAGGSDLVQETFLEAHLSIQDFRGRTEGELLGWLRRILLNNLANFRRHFRDVSKRDVTRECPMGPPAPAVAPVPIEDAISREQLFRLQAVLDQLPSPYREVIVWRSLERQPFRAIALHLNRPEKAVQRIWARAIQELQRRITPP